MTAALPPTPELDRLAAIMRTGAPDALANFVDWLEGEGIVLARYEHVEGYRDRQLVPQTESTERLFERHFGLDGAAMEREKRALLRHLGSVQQ